MEISKSNAKAFLVNHFQLDRKKQYTDENVVEFLSSIKTIQYDVLNVVGNNVDLVFQARFEGYTKQAVDKLIYQKRLLVDGWDKMMSIYLMSDYENMSYIRQEYANDMLGWLEYRNVKQALDFTDEILNYIHKHGPINSRSISIGSHWVNTTVKGNWGNKHVASVVCEYLLAKGELGIAYKKNRVKYYDTVYNLNYKLKQEYTCESKEQFLDWYFYRRIHGQGIVREKNNGNWLGCFLSNKEIRTKCIQRLLSQNKIVEVFVEGVKGVCYMSLENSKKFKKKSFDILPELVPQVRFIAPLDNLMWDRQLIHQLFDFSYSWEVYTPAKKRKYGYYVLPLLFGIDLVGRIEFKVENKKLYIINLWYENEELQDNFSFKEALKKELGSFQQYLQLY